MRINLLPAEILERRKYERWYPWVFAIGGVLVAVVLVIWLGIQFLSAQANSELQQTKESVTQLQTQAQAFAVFEQRETELAARQEIALSAREGMIDLGGLAEDITLVLPDEVWMDNLLANELTGLRMQLWTPDSTNKSIREDYKSIAMTLVRLNSLPTLYDVWLERAVDEEFNFDGTDKTVWAVSFELSSKLATSSVEATPASPAPPSPTPAQ